MIKNVEYLPSLLLSSDCYSNHFHFNLNGKHGLKIAVNLILNSTYEYTDSVKFWLKFCYYVDKFCRIELKL